MMRKFQSLGNSLFVVMFVGLLGCTSTQVQTPDAQSKAVTSDRTTVLDHVYFTIEYDKTYGLAKYVKYRSTEEQLRTQVARRRDRFKADPILTSAGQKAIQPNDYKGTFYDRGHLAPSASFRFSQEANDRTFIMSNIAPQKPTLNRKMWKKLEMEERRMGCGEGKILVYTGPVVKEGFGTLPSGVPIPDKFFKLIIDETPPKKAIAFVFSQEDSSSSLETGVVPPLTVSKFIGDEVLNAELANESKEILERSVSLDSWARKNCTPYSPEIGARGRRKSNSRVQ